MACSADLESLNITQREGECNPCCREAWIAVSPACMIEALSLSRKRVGWPRYVKAADTRPPATEPSVK